MKVTALGRGSHIDKHPGFYYLRNDCSTFELFRHKQYPEIGMLVPPMPLEVSGSTLKEVLRDTAKEGVKKVILNVSGQPPETNESYAKRISELAPEESIKRLVVVGLGAGDINLQYQTANSLEDAIQMLLETD